MTGHTRIFPFAAVLLIAVALSPGSVPAQSTRNIERPPAALQIRLANLGFGDVESTEEDCPAMRRDGKEVLTARLRLVDDDAAGGLVEYQGQGRFSADIDACGLTPNRDDPGQVHDRGDVLGNFHGDNFLGCLLTTRVPEHSVRVTLSISMVDVRSPNYVEVEWEPTGPVAVDVRTKCEPAFDADYKADITESYQGGGSRQITGYDLVTRMVAPGGVLRDGAYRDPDSPQWTYTVGEAPPENVAVRIEGPACGCMNAEDAKGPALRFTAKATEPGGTFTAFEVRPSGPAPAVAANAGGVTPRLELVPTRETRPVTLSVAYALNGKTYRSEPFQVSFCALGPIEPADGTWDRSFDGTSPGTAKLGFVGSALRDGADVSSQLKWELEEMPAPTKRSPNEATGARVAFTYEGLPTRSRAFGPRTVTARLKAGPCLCERTAKPRLFFTPRGTNHPPGDGGTGRDRTGDPNWVYYWLQTGATAGIDASRVEYQAHIPAENSPTDNVTGRYLEQTDLILFGDRVIENGCRGRVARAGASLGVAARFFDCFAETLRHENQHRVEWAQWWGNRSNNLGTDTDMDGVPDDVEKARPGCSWTSSRSCTERPFPDVTDREIDAYYVGWTWAIGSKDAEDWACEGNQWQGGDCPE